GADLTLREVEQRHDRRALTPFGIARDDLFRLGGVLGRPGETAPALAQLARIGFDGTLSHSSRLPPDAAAARRWPGISRSRQSKRSPSAATPDWGRRTGWPRRRSPATQGPSRRPGPKAGQRTKTSPVALP